MLILWVLQWSGGARATVPALIMASGPFAGYWIRQGDGVQLEP